MISVEELKKATTVKGVRNVRRGLNIKDESNRGMYRPDNRMGLERERLLVETYKKTEGEPMVLRRAKALKNILENMTVYIRGHERIVGNYSETPNDVFIPLDLTWRSFRRMIIEGEAQTLLDDKGKAELNELCKYWDGKSTRDIQVKTFKGCEQLEKYWQYDGTYMWSHFYENGTLDYEKLFQVGLNGVIKQCQDRLMEINKTIPFDYMEQKNLLEAVIITCQAAINWGHRFADKARELAAQEKDPERKKHLEQIAVTCDWVPGNPPRSFQEALQSFWFCHIISKQIEFPSTGIGLRIDKLGGPFYVADIKAGRTTKEDTLDLLRRFWMKFEEQGFAFTPSISGIYAGVQTLSSMTIGGLDKDGKDITNDVTYLILDTAEAMHTVQPSLSLRVHKGTPKKLLERATDVVATGIGYPSFFNDESLIPLLQRWGCSLEEARDYTFTGCVYIDIPGKNAHRRSAGYFNMARTLWWALHRGVNPETGEQYGARTPDPATFKSVEDVMQAFLTQVDFFINKMLQVENVTKSVYETYMPRPFKAALTRGCVEQGKDIGGFKDPNDGISNFCISGGQTNVADSLSAIKKFVFEDKEVTLPELIKIMDKNWEGHEELRQRILTRSPKFGNGDEYVDSICNEVHCRTEAIIEKITDKYGARYHWDGSVVSLGYSFGVDTAATPDGRKAGEPLSDGSLSPMVGRDMKGPSGVLASCAKVDTLHSYNQLLNQRFMPQFLKEGNKEKFVSYLRTWHDMGIPHIQFNVVSSANLRDAQKHPEKYTDLIVRVAGYSAYFNDLSKGLQDNIIERTEQGL
ncbi:MAG: pyruvate formate lyase family protein [Dehalococcoidales bacterium]|nr:pyruvate formate lyase family protein [Dehalococcoidales bacterium]